MDIQTAIHKMQTLLDEQEKGYTNQESDHMEADAILCNVLVALGHEYEVLVDIYEKIAKWYS